jgi:uncharacterized phage-associated protein
VTVSAHDVADALRTRARDIGAVKLHKLLYYAQGWHLAAHGTPLFIEEIKAWTNGPVVATLWADEKHNRPRPTPSPIEDHQAATVDFVLKRYGSFTSKELIRMTHAEDPWRDASETDDAAAPQGPTITSDAIRRWFAAQEDHQDHMAAVERARQRTDIYSFKPVPHSPELEAFIEEARSPGQIVETRPA